MSRQRKPLLVIASLIGALATSVTFAGGASAGPGPAPQQCNGIPVTITTATAGDDNITGTPGPDVISAGPGQDSVDGQSGDDVICGGAGNDLLIGGPVIVVPPPVRGVVTDNDTVRGGPASDRIQGGDGSDTLGGADGNETGLVNFQGNPASLTAGVFGETGSDSLRGGFGDDHLDGGEANDSHDGGVGNDVCLDLLGESNGYVKCETVPPPPPNP